MRPTGKGSTMRVAFRLTKYNRYSFIPIAWCASRLGASVVLCHSPEEVLSSGADVAFYSFMTPQAKEAYREAHFLSGKLLLVAGGPHPSALPREVLDAGFDAVCVGEFEPVARRLFSDMESGSVSGIYGLSAEGFPRYSMEPSSYTGPVELVRGCPFGCKFCQVSYLFGRRPRYRGLGEVLREAVVLRERGRRFIRFIAPNALSYMSPDGVRPNVPVLRGLLESLAELGFSQIFFGSFPSEVRPDSVTEEAASLMAEFCANRRVVVGAQSGSNERLLELGRGHTVEDVELAVATLNRHGFEVSLDFIFGFPGETQKELFETVSFMERMLSVYRVRVHAHAFIPLPGTPYWGVPPSPIPRWLNRLLHALERDGLLDGNWSQQEHFRRELCRGL